LLDGHRHAVFADGGQDVIGNGFERINGVAHGEAESGPFDHLEVIRLVAYRHDRFTRDIELARQFC